jgi:hypothetical protein
MTWPKPIYYRYRYGEHVIELVTSWIIRATPDGGVSDPEADRWRVWLDGRSMDSHPTKRMAYDYAHAHASGRWDTLTDREKHHYGWERPYAEVRAEMEAYLEAEEYEVPPEADERQRQAAERRRAEGPDTRWRRSSPLRPKRTQPE